MGGGGAPPRPPGFYGPVLNFYELPNIVIKSLFKVNFEVQKILCFVS